MSVGEVAGRRHPEYGAGVYDLACDTCGATWCGEPGMACPWCVAAAERQRVEQRRLLLFPPFLYDHGPRFDELSAIDKAVWDRTRGEARGAGSIEAWGERLGHAVQSGLITSVEADAALDRAERKAVRGG